jgi:hypothetical protein
VSASAPHEGAADDDALAREAHSAATLLALLLLLWGAVALASVPLRPFGTPNVLQMVAATPALVYFVLRRNQPSRRIAVAFSSFAVVYTLAQVPWAAVAWCALGRPWEAFTVPQIGSVCMAFVVPRRLSRGVVLIGLFAAESLFVYLYMKAVGLSALVPITEPFTSVAFAGLGISLFLLRLRRHELAEHHIRVQAEVEALRRIAPLFASVRRDLESQLGAIEGEIETLGTRRQADKASRTMGRAVQRLSELSRRLDRVVAPPAGRSGDEAERRLLDRDAQLGTTILAAIGSLLSVGALFMMRNQGPLPVFFFAAKAALDATLLAYLLITHDQPSRSRSSWALMLLILTALAIASYNEVVLLHANRPFASLLGYKLIMLCLGVTAASRFGLSLALVLLTAVDAMTVYFWLNLGAHKDIIASAEPWVSLIVLVVALSSLRLREQRRVASLHLLRAETEVKALNRRAAMFLSLRDRLNSPLQTLVLGAGRHDSQLSPESLDRIRGAVTVLVALSRALTELDAIVPTRSYPRLDGLS